MIDQIWTVPDYGAMTLLDFVLNALWGWAGSLSVTAALNRVIMLPTRENGGWRLNAPGEWFSAALVGMLINTSFAHAAVAGGLAPIVIGYVIYRGTNLFRTGD